MCQGVRACVRVSVSCGHQIDGEKLCACERVSERSLWIARERSSQVSLCLSARANVCFMWIAIARQGQSMHACVRVRVDDVWVHIEMKSFRAISSWIQLMN